MTTLINLRLTIRIWIYSVFFDNKGVVHKYLSREKISRQTQKLDI
jgi:hypothetical protein